MTHRSRRLPRPARRALAALTAAVVPRAPELEIELEPIVTYVEQFRAHLPRLMRVLFPLGLLLLEYGTLLFGFSWRRFSGLAPDRATAYVESWIASRSWLRRELIKGVKGLCLCAYYSDE